MRLIVIRPPLQFVLANPRAGASGNIDLFVEIAGDAARLIDVGYLRLCELFVPNKKRRVYRVKNTLSNPRNIVLCEGKDAAIAEMLRRGAMQVIRLMALDIGNVHHNLFSREDLLRYYWQQERVRYG